MNIKVGNKVQQGELIAKVDLDHLKSKEVDNAVLLAVTNENDLEIIAKEKDLVITNSLVLKINKDAKGLKIWRNIMGGK